MRFPFDRFTTGARHTHGGDAVDIVHDTLPLVGADAEKWMRQGRTETDACGPHAMLQHISGSPFLVKEIRRILEKIAAGFV